MPDIFNPSYIIEDIPSILRGLPVTLEIVLFAAIVGWAFGLLLALVKMHRIPVLYQICGVFVSFTRGTPELVQLFLAFYGIPVVLQYTNYYWGTGISINGIPKMLFVLVAFTNIMAAYSAESFRATLEGVDKGQMEAALSTGMSKFNAYRKIVLPQALVVAVPSLGAQFVSMLKGTSLAFVVSVVDMTSAGQLAASRTYRYLEMYIALAALYWILSGLFSVLFRLLEKRLKRNERVIVDTEPAVWVPRVKVPSLAALAGDRVERKPGYGLADLQPAQAI
ncbi:amino acid ABC transporter permease [Bifidobacterium avesanii]|uniref:ABC transporter permease subunit n=1 Tax=Bifidobacterium avesanii TaxID=1798157 RepID=A0A7K3TJB1_9BIFI|nr:amino acid ABC transporter permease [Bifidobacterium avesanii]KAB8290977.1 L-cystine transport system permease protein TcyL [Bifidobacterium avesanii]NEG78744.1 ABC transporter permease subunit [Bifidobacterium avesanii]